MRFVSFNVNGIRARQHQLEAVTQVHSPDILALQETKVIDDDFPLQSLEDLGYPHVAYYGQKGHYGVALASRHPFESVQLGVPWRAEDQQRRFVSAEVKLGGQALHVINGYFHLELAREPGAATSFHLGHGADGQLLLPCAGDFDGDGIINECSGGPVCPDSDGDGIPDYLDPNIGGLLVRVLLS